MERRKRADMIAQTRVKLLAAGRRAFAAKGYADAPMEDLTSEAGLTRGALYHHFGDKKGLFEAVVAEIDAEMSKRLKAVIEDAETLWDGFVDECIASMEMALEPEFQRIVLLDGPAVLGDPSKWPSQSQCLESTMGSLRALIAEGTIEDIDVEATARLVNGAALNGALWIANAADPETASRKAAASFRVFVSGLKRKEAPPIGG